MVTKAKQRDPLHFSFQLSEDPLRAAFQRRSLDALNRISSQATTESLAEALAATTDVGTLARILGDPVALGPAIAELDPLSPLVARNAEHRAEILKAAGGTLTAEEAGAFLGITRQAVDKRRRSHALLGLRQRSDWRYPRCQFDDARGDVIAGFPTLLKAFADADPWVTLDFLLAPEAALGDRTPLDCLKSEGWTDALARLVRIEQGDGFA
jgi:hypothetical protein